LFLHKNGLLYETKSNAGERIAPDLRAAEDNNGEMQALNPNRK
jgi:hypothetical protein